MAHAYTPGLKVTARTYHECRRTLPIPGEVIVQQGDRVQSSDVVAQANLPGDVTPLNLANLLSVSPADVPACMLRGEGERIEKGELLAESQGIFGFFKSRHIAKVSGTIESVSKVTGQVMVRGEPQPVRVLAYLAGEVLEVLPREGVVIGAHVSFVQGIFGIGGEAFGTIRMACPEADQDLTEELIPDDMRGQIVVGGARVTGTALRRAADVAVSAIITGGIDDDDLRDLLGHDLGVAITGGEQVGLTLVLTEGFGTIAMAQRTWQLLESRAGDRAAVNGATQIRAGVQRPEILIPLTQPVPDDSHKTHATSGYLEIGSPVRIIRDPYFGLIGTVAALPEQPHRLPSGSMARVLSVKLDAGEDVVVPRANVELLED